MSRRVARAPEAAAAAAAAAGTAAGTAPAVAVTETEVTGGIHGRTILTEVGETTTEVVAETATAEATGVPTGTENGAGTGIGTVAGGSGRGRVIATVTGNVAARAAAMRCLQVAALGALLPARRLQAHRREEWHRYQEQCWDLRLQARRREGWRRRPGRRHNNSNIVKETHTPEKKKQQIENGRFLSFLLTKSKVETVCIAHAP